MATPLTDAINALTTYANSVTGASDTTLSDAVDTLAAGYGGGGSMTYELITKQESIDVSSQNSFSIDISNYNDVYIAFRAVAADGANNIIPQFGVGIGNPGLDGNIRSYFGGLTNKTHIITLHLTRLVGNYWMYTYVYSSVAVANKEIVTNNINFSNPNMMQGIIESTSNKAFIYDGKTTETNKIYYFIAFGA